MASVPTPPEGPRVAQQRTGCEDGGFVKEIHFDQVPTVTLEFFNYVMDLQGIAPKKM